MKINTTMHKVQTTFNSILSGGIMLFSLIACSDEQEFISGEDESLQIGSITSKAVDSNTANDKYEQVTAGTYYLGYTAKNGNADSETITITAEGKINGASSQINGKKWGIFKAASPKENTCLTLDNVSPNGNIQKDQDVLWGNFKGWCVPLNFTLSHRMSKVTIDIKNSLNPPETISSISLKDIATTGIFDRKSGDVTKEASSVSDVGITNQQAVLLPPQQRTDDMKLVVATQGYTFTSALPLGMLYLGSSKLLEFKAGYNLAIKAELVNDGESKRILFTAATLEDWTFVGNGTIIAKEAGIYSDADLNAWITAYNKVATGVAAPGDPNTAEATEDCKALLKYGSYSSNQWTFHIWQNINISSISPITPIPYFRDKLNGHGYTITGINNESDLVTIKENGTVENLQYSKQ